MQTDSSRDFKVRQLKGKKECPGYLSVGSLAGLMKGKTKMPERMDMIIDPKSTNEYLDRKEMLEDFISQLMPRLKPFEREVFIHYFQCGYTQEETAAFLLKSRPYITQTLGRIEKKILRLVKVYKF